LIAFDVGGAFDPTKTGTSPYIKGFKIIGTHTDSPCLKLAPVSKAKFKSFSQAYVSTYGGGLWHTWFDRDLILAGKVVY
jgi:aspartyl aminopeptidase